ncbi:MAG: hypothetical protein GEU88_20665, partial [Solirubrobacterales bacterium]|nr:hypothetical protein [Solirubrobacterales bacterium]
MDAAHVYWASFSGGSIGRANLDGTGVKTSFITGAERPIGVAVDSAQVYWTNFGTGTIGSADLDGSNINQSFITGAGGPAGVAVDSLPATCDGEQATMVADGKKTIGTPRDDVIV